MHVGYTAARQWNMMGPRRVRQGAETAMRRVRGLSVSSIWHRCVQCSRSRTPPLSARARHHRPTSIRTVGETSEAIRDCHDYARPPRLPDMLSPAGRRQGEPWTVSAILERHATAMLLGSFVRPMMLTTSYLKSWRPVSSVCSSAAEGWQHVGDDCLPQPACCLIVNGRDISQFNTSTRPLRQHYAALFNLCVPGSDLRATANTKREQAPDVPVRSGTAPTPNSLCFARRYQPA